MAKHAVSLQQAGHGASLDDLDEIAVPELYSSSPDLYTGSFSFADAENNPILPSPYMSGFQSSDNDSFHWTDGTFDGAAHFLPNSYEELDLDSLEANDTVLDSTSGRVASLPTDKEVLKRHAAVQVNISPYFEFNSLENKLRKCLKFVHLSLFVLLDM